MPVTYRDVKGSSLTSAEIDANFRDIVSKQVYNGTSVTLPNQAITITGSVLPTVRPSLNLDFVNSKQLDQRVSFSRASTAKYYDGKTSVKAEENLLLQSQTFTTTWTVSNTSLGSVTTAPDGTTTAYPLTASANNGTLLQTFTATAVVYTFSIYIQRVTGTGNIDITVDGTTYSTQTTSGSWTRFSITTTPTAGSKTAGIRLAVSGNVINIWGAQLEQRSTVTAYTPTTTAPITNYIPVLVTAPVNTPRLDYNPVTGQPLGLLIEEARTNLIPSSNTFSIYNPATTSTTVNSSYTIAPDGTQTATNFVHTGAGSAQIWNYIVTTLPSGTNVTWSVYAKQSSVVFDRAGVDQTTLVSNNTSIPVGNGWWRHSVTRVTSVVNAIIGIGVSLGESVSGITLWGAQLEASSFATSYIPTTTGTAIRSADNASMVGVNFSSWYNQSQGTVYIEYDNYTVGNGGNILRISNSTDEITYYGRTATTDGVYVTTNGVGGLVNQDIINPRTTAIAKAAYTLQDNNFQSVGNGSLRSADTTCTFSNTMNKVGLGWNGATGGYMTGHIRKFNYYPIALSTANLQALTS